MKSGSVFTCAVFYMLPSVLPQALTWSRFYSLSRLNKGREEEEKIKSGENQERSGIMNDIRWTQGGGRRGGVYNQK